MVGSRGIRVDGGARGSCGGGRSADRALLDVRGGRRRELQARRGRRRRHRRRACRRRQRSVR